MKAVLLRLPDELHAALAEEAYQSRMSLAAFIRLKLHDAVSGVVAIPGTLTPKAAEAVKKGWNPETKPASVGNVKRIRDEHGNRIK